MRTQPFLSLLASCAMLLGVATTQAQQAANWTEWRGGDARGVAPEGEYPTTFGKPAWTYELPGKGSASLIALGDNLYSACGIDGEDGLICLSKDGKEQWRVTLGKERPGKHRNGSGSNSTPTTNGKHIFTYHKSGTLAAVDLDGTVAWKKNLQDMFGPDTLWWDLGTSPVIADGNVVIAVMQSPEDDGPLKDSSYLAAFDCATGDLAWKADRSFKCEKETDQSYTTPVVVEDGDSTQVVTFGADFLTSHDAATGKEVWRCGGFNPANKAFWRVIASPAVSGDMLLVPYGRANWLAGVKLGGKGDVTKTHLTWTQEGFGADAPTPIATGDLGYILSDKGDVQCLDLNTGKVNWTEKLPKAKGKFYASPAIAGNTLYMVRETGIAYVARVSNAGMKLISKLDTKEQTAATPLLLDNCVYLRGEKTLRCYK